MNKIVEKAVQKLIEEWVEKKFNEIFTEKVEYDGGSIYSRHGTQSRTRDVLKELVDRKANRLIEEALGKALNQRQTSITEIVDEKLKVVKIESIKISGELK